VWSIGLTLRPRQFEFPVLALTLPIAAVFALKMARSVMLYRAKVPCGAADRLGAAIAGLALSHTIAKAVWRGVFTSRPTFLRTPKCAHAPVLIQGLAMAWEELLVLISLSLAMACVGFTHHFATWETKGWILLLGLQALPYAASVALGLGAAIRSSQQGGLRVSLPVGHFAAAGTEVMASTGNAD